MAGVSLSGLSSGLDTETIITQLMQIEAASKNRFVKQEKYATGRKTALEDVAKQLRGLSTAMAELRSAATWGDVQSISTADPTKVTARQTGTAPIGTFTVEVTKFARAEQRSFDYVERNDLLGQPQTQRLTIDGVDVDITAGSTQQQVVDTINATAGITVQAGLVNGRLTLTHKEPGKAFSATSSTNSLTNEQVVAQQKTGYTVNGVAQTETTSSVVQPGGLPGVELTLKALGPTTITIGAPAPDAEKVKTKVKAFVDAYNATLDLVASKLKEEKVKSPVTTTDFTKGALRNDPALTSLAARLRQGVQGIDSTTTIDSLAELGVAVPKGSASGVSSAEALAGKLTFDEARFASAMATSPADVRKTLGATSGFDGIIGQLEDVVDPVGKATTGYLARSSESADAEAARMRARQTDMDRRLKLKEERLREQFTALETALGRSNSQTSWLQGQISGLASWS
jgi:flagellar hook-associated protein 2